MKDSTRKKNASLLSRDKATELVCDGGKHDSISFEKKFFGTCICGQWIMIDYDLLISMQKKIIVQRQNQYMHVKIERWQELFIFLV